MKKLTVTEIIALFIVFIFWPVSCMRGTFVEDSEAVQALETQGYSNVKINSYHWFMVTLRGCGQDAALFKTTATNPAGKNVDINVCVGWPFKGATIRTP